MMIIEGIDGNNSKLTYVTRYLFKPYFCDLKNVLVFLCLKKNYYCGWLNFFTKYGRWTARGKKINTQLLLCLVLTCTMTHLYDTAMNIICHHCNFAKKYWRTLTLELCVLGTNFSRQQFDIYQYFVLFFQRKFCLKKPTDLDLHCLSLRIRIFINNLDQVIWLAEN